jgi:flagellar L-ring protein precursor FlgH
MRRDIDCRKLVVILLSILATACSSTGSKISSEGFETSRPPFVVPPPAENGAIFQAGYEMGLYQDMKARNVGDIITVILTEKTDATKQASTNTSKDSSVNMANPTLFGKQHTFSLPRPFQASEPGMSFETGIDSKSSFAGAGDSTQKNSLTGNITVTVSEVLPNGNLMLKGQKKLTINQGDEVVQFSGIVRQADIRPDNTVSSTKVADARIAYVGEGDLDSSNSKGWLTRFFNSKWWPF